LKNSADSPHSEPISLRDALLVCAFLGAVITVAAWWVFRRGYILYYGDAQSHLNLSRSIMDSRTPGYDQLGTVWLPVLHVICLPFVSRMSLWSTGLAGTIPVGVCFCLAGTAFFFAALETYRTRFAAWIVVLCFALNPNLLYLASIPMTEVVFLAGLAVLLFALIRFESNKNVWFIALGVAASWWMSLTRYDGWFLIPFAAIWFAWSAKKRWQTFLLFGFFASLAPLYWTAHNWWETSNALDFYNGPYSAMAIQGDKPYPGYHNWALAMMYYAKAGQLCAGWMLLFTGVAGFISACARGAYRPVFFLLLTPVFYIWSIHSSKNPIFVPQLPPHGYYNSRYGIAVVAFAAFASGALVKWLPSKWKRFSWLIPAVAILPWLLKPSQENWICWKESEVNSVSRRAWTEAGAEFLNARYVMGQGILTPSASGDVAGIFCLARIPLSQTINIGNGPTWIANTARPDLVHQQLWAVDQADDPLSRALARHSSPYLVRREIRVNGAPDLQILERGTK
jgi:hypothetical protein